MICGHSALNHPLEGVSHTTRLEPPGWHAAYRGRKSKHGLAIQNNCATLAKLLRVIRPLTLCTAPCATWESAEHPNSQPGAPMRCIEGNRLHCSLGQAGVVCSIPKGQERPRRPLKLRCHATLTTTTCTQKQPQLEPSPPRDSQRWPPVTALQSGTPEDALHMYVALEPDVLSPQNTLGYEQALKVGLRALRLLGITGISVDVLWGVVERAGPQQYNWSGYKLLFDLIIEMGFKLKVNLCFNSSEAAALPDWLQQVGEQHPDIWYADKAGQRNKECLTLGIDDAPCLNGRTGLQAYSDLMRSFRQEFGPQLCSGHITDIVIGLGPRAELRYPSHNPEQGWEFPGVGDFQCYDQYMLANLKACAQQVQQPTWGLGGPHDAGPSKSWPHQSGFFSHNGNWCSPYGRFFLQWYSEMLSQHAQRVLGAAATIFAGTPVVLNARIPGCCWWYNTSSHGAELTAGYHNTMQRDGYLPAFSALAAHKAGVHLGMAEARTSEYLPSHCADPERLLTSQRTVAAALRMPVTLENTELRFDEAALARVYSALFDSFVSQGIEVPRPRALVFNRMSDVMFEPANWQRFKAFVRKVRAQAEENLTVLPCTISTNQ